MCEREGPSANKVRRRVHPLFLPSPKRQHLNRFDGLGPESQGQNLALTVLYVPHSLDSSPTFEEIVHVQQKVICLAGSERRFPCKTRVSLKRTAGWDRALHGRRVVRSSTLAGNNHHSYILTPPNPLQTPRLPLKPYRGTSLMRKGPRP